MVMKNLRTVLEEEHEPIPDERDLRTVVRSSLRHVRRERAAVSVHDLLKPSESGRWFLSIDCIARLRDMQQARRAALLKAGIDFDRPGFLEKQPESFGQSLGLSDADCLTKASAFS